MKKSLIFLGLIGMTMTYAQEGKVGINTDTPKAALDIKTTRSEDTEVLRFSTKPNGVGAGKSYVIFVGEENEEGYDLRQVTMADLVKSMMVEIPSLSKITVTSTANQTFAQQNSNVAVKLGKELVNTNPDDYVFSTTEDGTIEIKNEGTYEVSAWVGFESLPSYEGDMIISLAKKSVGESVYSNFKRVIISRSANGNAYSDGRGVGTSFAFVDEFRKGDKIRLHINTIGLSNITTSLRTLSGSTSLSVVRATK